MSDHHHHDHDHSHDHGHSHTQTAAEPLVDLDAGWVDDRLTTDNALYDVELERIFAEDWVLIAHESQLPMPGDFVTSRVGEDPMLLVRQEDGTIAGFLNSCRHRGLQVCAAPAGHADEFVCGWHGWTYSTAGILTKIGDDDAVPLVGAGVGLVAVEHLTTVDGWIYVSWHDGEPLGEPWTETAGLTPAGPLTVAALTVDWRTAAIRLRNALGADGIVAGLAGPFVDREAGIVAVVQPRGPGGSELRWWRTSDAPGADARAQAWVDAFVAGPLDLTVLPRVAGVQVRLRGPGEARAAAPMDVCAPAAPALVVRRALADDAAREVYATWLSRLDAATVARISS